MAGTKQWRAADGDSVPTSDSRFYIETGGKLQALGAQTLYLNTRKAGVPVLYQK